jgi:hypothetical protein
MGRERQKKVNAKKTVMGLWAGLGGQGNRDWPEVYILGL